MSSMSRLPIPAVSALSALLAAVVLAGCSSAPAETGTIQGTATLGPTEPVCRQGEPCSQPYSGPLALVRASDGKTVRSFTATNGTFQVEAAPGTYAIRHTADNNGWPTCRSPDFTVQAGATTAVAVDCDTGIR
jgi:hypothetical protein